MKFQELLDRIAEPVPGYRRSIFKTVIVGLLIGNGGGTIAAIFRHFGGVFRGTNITSKRFYTFFNSAKIPWQFIHRRVADLISDRVAVAGRLLVVLDDTTYGKTGKNISGCGVHFDHAAKTNASRWIFGHCRVLAGLLVNCHGRWACLPMRQRNFVPDKERKGKPRSEVWHKTKNGIAAALVNGIRKLFDLPALLITDSWFGNGSFLRALQGAPGVPPIHLLSRLRISSALCEMPEGIRGKKRGRPRKYGRRLPKVEKLAADMRADSRIEKMFIYGRERDCEYSELICMSKAWKCQVKVVFVYRSNGTVFPLISNDLTLTAKQMIEYYAARWKIESGFKELKQELGAIDSQCRNRNAVENHFDLCCLSMTLAWIYAVKQDAAPKRRHPDRRNSAFSFGDVRRTIAAELRGQSIFHNGCSESVKRAIKIVRDSLFNRAA